MRGSIHLVRPISCTKQETCFFLSCIDMLVRLSVCFLVCLPSVNCLSVSIFVCLYVCLSKIGGYLKSVCMSKVFLFVCLSNVCVYLINVCLCIWLSVFLFMCVSIWSFDVFLSACLICLFLRLTADFSYCLSVCSPVLRCDCKIVCKFVIFSPSVCPYDGCSV